MWFLSVFSATDCVELLNGYCCVFFKVTVALKTERNHMDYTVETEIVDYTGGFPGDIVITEKLLNGFKMAHTGSAKSVTVKVYVKGGFY